MSSTYGEKIKISVFGESHGNGIGVVIDGLPAGVKLIWTKCLFRCQDELPAKTKPQPHAKKATCQRYFPVCLEILLQAHRYVR